MNIFIYRDGQEYGPYTQADIRAYLRTGEITTADHAREKSATEWTTIEVLFPSPTKTPPPPQVALSSKANEPDKKDDLRSLLLTLNQPIENKVEETKESPDKLRVFLANILAFTGLVIGLVFILIYIYTPGFRNVLGNSASIVPLAPGTIQNSATGQSPATVAPPEPSQSSSNNLDQPPQQTTTAAQTETDVPQDSTNHTTHSGNFKIIQIISPGRALACQVIYHPATIDSYDNGGGYNPGYTEDGDQVYLLRGLPLDLVDDDTWSGTYFQGDHVSYTTAGGSTKTIRSYIVSQTRK